MKKTKLLTVVLSSVAFVLLIGFFVWTRLPKAANAQGEVILQYVSLTNEIIEEHTVEFFEGDVLIDLVTETFDNVTVEDGMILTFEDYVTPSDWATFLGIKVNGEDSAVGILDIVLTDGMVVSFVVTEMIW